MDLGLGSASLVGYTAWKQIAAWRAHPRPRLWGYLIVQAVKRSNPTPPAYNTCFIVGTTKLQLVWHCSQQERGNATAPDANGIESGRCGLLYWLRKGYSAVLTALQRIINDY